MASTGMRLLWPSPTSKSVSDKPMLVMDHLHVMLTWSFVMSHSEILVFKSPYEADVSDPVECCRNINAHLEHVDLPLSSINIPALGARAIVPTKSESEDQASLNDQLLP